MNKKWITLIPSLILGFYITPLGIYIFFHCYHGVVFAAKKIVDEENQYYNDNEGDPLFIHGTDKILVPFKFILARTI
jgi:hypothetical protein